MNDTTNDDVPRYRAAIEAVSSLAGLSDPRWEVTQVFDDTKRATVVTVTLRTTKDGEPTEMVLRRSVDQRKTHRPDGSVIDRALAVHCRAAELLILDGMLCAAVTRALAHASDAQILRALGDLVDVKDYLREGQMERARLAEHKARAVAQEQADATLRAAQARAAEEKKTMSDSRPDYVKCVLTGRYDRAEDHPQGPHREQKTWCGREISGEWVFEDPTHAVLNAVNGGRLLVCANCAEKIAATLHDHQWEEGPPDVAAAPQETSLRPGALFGRVFERLVFAFGGELTVDNGLTMSEGKPVLPGVTTYTARLVDAPDMRDFRDQMAQVAALATEAVKTWDVEHGTTSLDHMLGVSEGVNEVASLSEASERLSKLLADLGKEHTVRVNVVVNGKTTPEVHATRPAKSLVLEDRLDTIYREVPLEQLLLALSHVVDWHAWDEMGGRFAYGPIASAEQDAKEIRALLGRLSSRASVRFSEDYPGAGDPTDKRAPAPWRKSAAE